MRELPILFSTPMVQAILEGRKTVTRRIVKGKLWGGKEDILWVRESFQVYDLQNNIISMPQYKIAMAKLYCFKASEKERAAKFGVVAEKKWKPSIHMPKDIARIWLQIERIGLEQLWDITSGEAKEEGVVPKAGESYRHAFKRLWMEINGKENWEANPMVWTIRFKALSTTGKPRTI